MPMPATKGRIPPGTGMRQRMRRLSESMLSLLAVTDTKEKLNSARAGSVIASKAFILLIMISLGLMLTHTLFEAMVYISIPAKSSTSANPNLMSTDSSTKSSLSVQDYPAILVSESEGFKVKGAAVEAKMDTETSLVLPRSEDEVTHAPGFNSAAEPVARLIVMTMDRVTSLGRLLDSLSKANYGEDHVNLDIWIDRLNDKPIDEAVLFKSRNMEWKRGTKTIHKRKTNAGLYQQWIYTWNITAETTEFAVILEDDLEVSPAFYQWLIVARAAYSQDSDVGAFTLQRSTLRPKAFEGARSGVLSISPDHHVFKYKLLGTWGFAPQRDVWVEFRKWFEEKRAKNEKPYVPGLVTTTWYKSQEVDGFAPHMWSQWWIKFVDEKGFYTVTSHLPDGSTLAANWREKGLHYSKTKALMDFPVFKGNVEQFSMPDNPILVDWDGRIISSNDTSS